MFTTPSAFTSPLGPMHFAEPSSSSSTSLASLFSRDSTSSSASKRLSRPAKRSKPSPSKATISISGPVLISSSNPLVAPTDSSSFEPTLSAPSPPYGDASRTSSPPPPYEALPPSPSSPSSDDSFNRPVDHPLLPSPILESRFASWDTERHSRKKEEAKRWDGRVGEEVRRLGL
ncbi:putative Rab escort protein [Rhodotorula toruloides]|nr:putative Rab escort protein [Rhodotorula toruloides]